MPDDPPDEPAYVRAVAAAEIPNDKGRAIQVGGRCVLVCHSAGRFFAVANRCSHADEPLAGGKMRNAKLVCPVHGARFDLATGEALSAPATRPIRTFPSRLVDGWVEVAMS